MRNPTEMMREILTSETAKKIIDFVSPIYGDSYVGLWIYQAIGAVMGEVCGFADLLRYETNPVTADLLLDYWEEHYGIPVNKSLTVEERRSRLQVKIASKGPRSPEALASIVSAALNGAPVEVTENIAKNTFLVTILESAYDVVQAVKDIERNKPAHLVYQMRMQIEADKGNEINVASATTLAENYVQEIKCDFHEIADSCKALAPAFAVTYTEHFKTEVLN